MGKNVLLTRYATRLIEIWRRDVFPFGTRRDKRASLDMDFSSVLEVSKEEYQKQQTRVPMNRWKKRSGSSSSRPRPALPMHVNRGIWPKRGVSGGRSPAQD